MSKLKEINILIFTLSPLLMDTLLVNSSLLFTTMPLLMLLLELLFMLIWAITYYLLLLKPKAKDISNWPLVNNTTTKKTVKVGLKLLFLILDPLLLHNSNYGPNLVKKLGILNTLEPTKTTEMSCLLKMIEKSLLLMSKTILLNT